MAICNKEEVEKFVLEAVSDQIGEAKINLSDTLEERLGFDYIDLIEVLDAIEHEYSVFIDVTDLDLDTATVQTVADVLVERLERF